MEEKKSLVPFFSFSHARLSSPPLPRPQLVSMSVCSFHSLGRHWRLAVTSASANALSGVLRFLDSWRKAKATEKAFVMSELMFSAY